MAKAREAVLVWRSSPRTWHDLPLDTSGLFPRQFILPDNIPPGIRLKYYPRHVFFVFLDNTTSYPLLSLRCSSCYSILRNRSQGMRLFLWYVISHGSTCVFPPPYRFQDVSRGPEVAAEQTSGVSRETNRVSSITSLRLRAKEHQMNLVQILSRK